MSLVKYIDVLIGDQAVYVLNELFASIEVGPERFNGNHSGKNESSDMGLLLV